MTLMEFFKSTIRFFYHLTVGLTVLLIRAGLLYVICFLTLIAWVVVVGLVTWKTYRDTDHHLGWSAVAGGVTAALCGGLIVLLHRLVKDWLGLTSLSLTQILAHVFLRRPPPPPSSQRGQGAGGDVRREEKSPERTEERTHVKVTRTRRVVVSGSSSAEKRTTDSWR